MGLLDWLTQSVGSDMGASSMPMPPPMPTGAPPVQQTDQPPPGLDPMSAGGSPSNGPGLPLPPGGDQMTAGGIPADNSAQLGRGGLPPSPPVPLPPMPPGLRTGGGDGDVLPPGATPTGGAGLIPPSSAPPMAPASPGPQGFIGRSLGLDRNAAKTISGSLASGLKSVGENWNKPGVAAFAGSAGSALEGGNTAADKITDQQTKYLAQAIAAAKSGDEHALNLANTRLKLAQAKTAEEGDPEKTALTVARTREATARARKLEEGGGTKASVVNSPEQLYLRAIGATNSDGKLSLLKNAYIQASKDGQQDTPAAKAAKTAYETAYDETRDQHLKTLGVDPKIASKIGKQPGFSADNPIPSAGLTKEKFDKLPPGSYFINPANGGINPKTGTPWLLIKQPPAGANPPTQAQSPTPAAPPAPAPVTAPAGSAADRDEED